MDAPTHCACDEGLRFSDGSPFTAADVLFSFEAVYDDSIASPLADALRIDGKPIEVTALDQSTVIVRFPKPFSPGVRVLSNLPILPRHRLGTALAAGTLAEQWDVTTSPDSPSSASARSCCHAIYRVNDLSLLGTHTTGGRMRRAGGCRTWIG